MAVIGDDQDEGRIYKAEPGAWRIAGSGQQASTLTSPDIEEKPLTFNQLGDENLVDATGTPLDDIVVIGSIDDGHSDKNWQGTFEGKTGYDTAVIYGDPGGYQFHLPTEPSDYYDMPEEYWRDNESAYGKIIIVENLETGDTTALIGVEHVIFDPNKTINFDNLEEVLKSPLDEPNRIARDTKNGLMTQITIAEAIKQAEALIPQQLERAKLASSRAAHEIFDARYDKPWKPRNLKDKTDIQNLEALNNEVIDKVGEQIDLNETNMPAPDNAISPVSLGEAGIVPAPKR